MQEAPLMPKATAVWLVENTALSFDQVAEFCKLHPLEVKAIADGDAAQGIKGLDPIQTGQLTRDEIDKAVADPDHKLLLSRPKVRPAGGQARPKKKGPRYTPVSRRQDRPNAILWLLRNHPELKDAQIMRLVGTTKSTIAGIRERTHWNAASLTPARSGDARACARRSISTSRCSAPRRRSPRRPRPGVTLLPAAVTTAPQEPAEPETPGGRQGQGRSRHRRGVRQAQAAGGGKSEDKDE